MAGNRIMDVPVGYKKITVFLELRCQLEPCTTPKKNSAHSQAEWYRLHVLFFLMRQAAETTATYSLSCVSQKTQLHGILDNMLRGRPQLHTIISYPSFWPFLRRRGGGGGP